jgi:hypothetical protein
VSFLVDQVEQQIVRQVGVLGHPLAMAAATAAAAAAAAAYTEVDPAVCSAELIQHQPNCFIMNLEAQPQAQLAIVRPTGP